MIKEKDSYIKMFKTHRKKIIFTVLLSLLCLFFSVNITHAKSNKDDKQISAFIDDFKKPTSISIDNISSYEGTYQIERLVILTKDNVILDTNNRNVVKSYKGELSIEINQMTKVIDSTFKFQFREKELKNINSKQKKNPYEYIYFSRKIDLVKDIYADSTNIRDNIINAGLHYYAEEKKLIWEFPLTKQKRAIVILEKISDKIKNIKDFKYPLL